MRIVAVAFGLAMVALGTTVGHGDNRLVGFVPAGDAVSATVASVPMPASAPAGIEVLLQMR